MSETKGTNAEMASWGKKLVQKKAHESSQENQWERERVSGWYLSRWGTGQTSLPPPQSVYKINSNPQSLTIHDRKSGMAALWRKSHDDFQSPQGLPLRHGPNALREGSSGLNAEYCYICRQNSDEKLGGNHAGERVHSSIQIAKKGCTYSIQIDYVAEKALVKQNSISGAKKTTEKTAQENSRGHFNQNRGVWQCLRDETFQRGLIKYLCGIWC